MRYKDPIADITVCSARPRSRLIIRRPEVDRRVAVPALLRRAASRRCSQGASGMAASGSPTWLIAMAGQRRFAELLYNVPASLSIITLGLSHSWARPCRQATAVRGDIR